MLVAKYKFWLSTLFLEKMLRPAALLLEIDYDVYLGIHDFSQQKFEYDPSKLQNGSLFAHTKKIAFA